MAEAALRGLLDQGELDDVPARGAILLQELGLLVVIFRRQQITLVNDVEDET